MNIEAKYKDYAVMVSSNSGLGSGCVFQPRYSAFSYILTAKHCLVDGKPAEDFDKQSLNVQYPESGRTITVREVYFHQELDIAVILVDRLTHLPISEVYPLEKNEKVTVYGYPYKLRNAIEQRENIDCKVSFCHDDYCELSSELLQFTFNTSVPDNIKGFSGSGVFFEKNGRLYFGGIFARLKAEDGAYHKFCAYNPGVYDQLLAKNELTILSGQMPMLDPVILRKVFYLPYTKMSEQYYLKRKMDDSFNSRMDHAKHIWISGNSGVGKTNLVFRNLLKREQRFLYFDLSTAVNDSAEAQFDHLDGLLTEQCELQRLSTKLLVTERLSENLMRASRHFPNLVLFVDEVGVPRADQFRELINGLIAISGKVTNSQLSTDGMKWIIATRIDPMQHLENSDKTLFNKNKATTYFNFLHLKPWDDIELMGLLKIIETSVGLQVPASVANKIIEVAHGLPGRLKDVFERAIIENCTLELALEVIKFESYAGEKDS